MDRGADITVTGGPIADEQHVVSLFEGASSAEGKKHEDEWCDDEGYNADTYDMYASNHHVPEKNDDTQENETKERNSAENL